MHPRIHLNPWSILTMCVCVGRERQDLRTPAGDSRGEREEGSSQGRPPSSHLCVVVIVVRRRRG